MKQGILLLLIVTLLLSACVLPAQSSTPSVPESVSSSTISTPAVSSEAESIYTGYTGFKWGGPSGVFVYVGSEPLRTYPREAAPYAFPQQEEDPDDLMVQAINHITEYREEPEENIDWCLVVDDFGRSGYVRSTELRLMTPEEADISYLACSETLGGFALGDRIEKLIGELDTEYFVVYENGRIYDFLEQDTAKAHYTNEERFDIALQRKTLLDAFCDERNYVVTLRTSNKNIKTADGFAPGDFLKRAVDFYTAKYGAPLNYDAYYGSGKLRFVIRETEIGQNSYRTIVLTLSCERDLGESQAVYDTDIISGIELACYHYGAKIS